MPSSSPDPLSKLFSRSTKKSLRYITLHLTMVSYPLTSPSPDPSLKLLSRSTTKQLLCMRSCPVTSEFTLSPYPSLKLFSRSTTKNLLCAGPWSVTLWFWPHHRLIPYLSCSTAVPKPSWIALDPAQRRLMQTLGKISQQAKSYSLIS